MLLLAGAAIAVVIIIIVIIIVTIVVVTKTKKPPIDPPNIENKELFPSVHGGKMDWYPDWSDERTLTRSREVDPFDPNCVMRGRGVINFGNNVMGMDGESCRLYVRSPVQGHKWRNVEVTVFCKLQDPDYDSRGSGFAIGARSNHDISGDGMPCEAHGYYGKLWTTMRKFGITKEVYHGPDGPVYSSPMKADFEIPRSALDHYIGMKLVIQDFKGGVRLRVYGLWKGVSEWTLVKDYKDDGEWEAKRQIPCSYESYILENMSSIASPVTRGTQFMILRQSVPGAIWKNVSIREIAPLV